MTIIQLASPLQRAWLTALVVLWACFLFGGFLFGKTDRKSNRRMPGWARMASSSTLVVAAWSWYAFTRTSPVAAFSLLIAVGMTLGFIGDHFLAQVIPLPQPIFGGIAAFGLGHIAYIMAMLQFGNQSGLDVPALRWGTVCLWLLIGLCSWYFIVFSGNKLTALHIAALAYTLLLSISAGFATGLALQSPTFMPMALGAGLFLLSDLILAAQLFNNLQFPLIGDVVWLTYGPAQMLIVFAVNAALIVVGH